ncbi:hypothetical protein [Noviherbaspirillum galbum]|uniref:Uncharacterized protein n=1 Tax=Noviherbaspirillum galbum TaxID=2709383 RepID=A0A6B3SQ91_9BURK|nr:hypothetical protein [Noviherbaspirillum galbum]NEX62811.1 hypothetical protein [Noviherbaspirillum galbum]
MKALTVKDIAATTELKSDELSAVRGGCGYTPSMPSCYTPSLPGCGSSYGPSASLTKNDFNFAASQSLCQDQNTMVNNGNNVAFANCITSNVAPTQNGHNNISIG